MAKKKYLNIYYIFLLGVLFVIFFGLFSNSYAMTENEIDTFMDNYFDFLSTINSTASTQFENYYNINKSTIYDYIDNKDKIIALYFGGNYSIYLMNTEYNFYIKNNVMLATTYTSGMVRGTYTWFVLQNENIVNSVDARIPRGDFISITDSIFASNFTIYSDDSITTSYESNNYENISTTIINSISLTSSSNHKFAFTDKNQLQVNIEGDWNIEDFSFYIQKYDDGEWGNYTDVNDYYRLVNYSNPYYIFWNNINYFPVGTYRYMADYNSIGEQLYYSNEFQITNNIINNTGTGTVGDQNININIDTGKTVDNIKDFLGGDPTTTENELQSSFPTVNIDDPSHNFFVWVFDSIENIFTTTEDRTFTFSLFSGNSYTIHSNDITIPNNVVKTLVGLSCDFAICYYIIRDIHKTIEKVKKGNFESIAEEDISANML